MEPIPTNDYYFQLKPNFGEIIGGSMIYSVFFGIFYLINLFLGIISTVVIVFIICYLHYNSIFFYENYVIVRNIIRKDNVLKYKSIDCFNIFYQKSTVLMFFTKDLKKYSYNVSRISKEEKESLIKFLINKNIEHNEDFTY